MKTLRIAAVLAALATSAQAEDRISFVTNWGQDFYSASFMLDWVERFNESYDGVAEIDFVGGPEVTPATEQLTAVRNGLFDMMFGSAGYYVGQVPEGFALYASPLTPMEARESGALDVLNAAYNEKANAEVLGWVAAGVGYHVWLRDADVPLAEDGTPDLSGLKIRSSPFYNAWLESMGATVVPVPAPDIYSALERGIVDGAAWPGLGVTDYGWNEFIGARVDPPIWQFDNLVIVNLDAWNGYSEETRAALRESVAELEPLAHEHYASLAAEERQAVEAVGTEAVALAPEAAEAYQAAADELMWQQLQSMTPESYEALRAAFGG